MVRGKVMKVCRHSGMSVANEQQTRPYETCHCFSSCSSCPLRDLRDNDVCVIVLDHAVGIPPEFVMHDALQDQRFVWLQVDELDAG